MTICEKEYTASMLTPACDSTLIPQFTVNGINARMMQPTFRQRSGNIATLTFAKAHGWAAGTFVLVRNFAAGYNTPFLNAATPTPVAITVPSSTQISYANAGADEGVTAVTPSPILNWVSAVYQGVVNTVPTVVDTSISLGSPIVSWTWTLTRIYYTSSSENSAYTTTLSGQSPTWPTLFPAFMGAGTYFKISLSVTTASGLTCVAQQIMPQLVLAGETYPGSALSDAPDLGVFTKISDSPITYTAAYETPDPYIISGIIAPFPSGPGVNTNGPDSAFRWRMILSTNDPLDVSYLKTGQSIYGTYGPANPVPGAWPEYVTVSL